MVLPSQSYTRWRLGYRPSQIQHPTKKKKKTGKLVQHNYRHYFDGLIMSIIH